MSTLTGLPKGDKRRTLEDEYHDRGLIRPNQLKKVPEAERDNYTLVTFPWGRADVRGYKKTTPKTTRSKK